MPLPTASSVNFSVTPTSIPPLPSQFYSLIEAKLFDTSDTSVNLRWYRNSESSQRVEFINFTSSITSGFAANGVDDMAVVISDSTVTSINALTNECITSQQQITTSTSNPISRLRGGVLQSIFSLGLPSTTTYQGRIERRGLPADLFTATAQSISGYNFTLYAYFFPANWSFPGRSIATEGQMLMSLVTLGQYRPNSTAQIVAFEDVYDFYRVTSLAAFEASAFDPTNCIGTQTSESRHSGLSGGAKAGIAIAVIFVVSLVFIGVRYWHNHRVPAQNAQRLDDAAELSSVDSAPIR